MSPLLTRRARTASGTATQYTRRNDLTHRSVQPAGQPSPGPSAGLIDAILAPPSAAGGCSVFFSCSEVCDVAPPPPPQQQQQQRRPASSAAATQRQRPARRTERAHLARVHELSQTDGGFDIRTHVRSPLTLVAAQQLIRCARVQAAAAAVARILACVAKKEGERSRRTQSV
jgi:hypothetical protein